MLIDKTYLDRDRLFVHLNVVQQGAILALAQGIIMHQSAGRNLSIADARLIIGKVENHSPADTLLDQLVKAEWFIGGTAVTFFSPEVEEYAIIKLAQMVLVHFQEKSKDDKETARPRKFRHDYT